MIEENEMSDFIGGIRQIGPTYPVRPVQPADKERKPGQEAPKQQEPKPDPDENDDGHSIDEHA